MSKRCRRAIAVLLAAASVAPTPAAGQGSADLVRVPFPQDDGSLTPYTFQVGYPLVNLVYDTVMWRDADGVPRPWLAESVSRDGNRITIRLREGIRWHDGEPLTAEDVEFTFDYVAAHPHARYSPQLTDVRSVEAVDERTVVVELSRRSLGFLDQPLSDLPILPEHIWSQIPAGRVAPAGLPVGSGPYELTGHVPGRGYTFTANRDYFRGEPLVERIEVPIIRRPDESFRALQQGRVDMLPVTLDAATADQLEGLGVRVATGDSYLGTVLMLNTTRPPFDRGEARRAVAGAIDLERITDALSGLGDQAAAPAENGYLHPDSPWAPDQDLHEFAGDEARVRVAEAGLSPFSLLVPDNDPIREEIGNQIEAALRRAGAPVRVVELPSRKLACRVGEDRCSPDYQAAIWSSPALASYDPSFVEAVFGDPFHNALNYSGYNSNRFEALAARVDSAPSDESRRRAVSAVLSRLAADAPVVPLVFPQGAFAYSPGTYDGWIYVKGSGILDKRSFLPDPARHPEQEDPIGNPIDPDSAGGGTPLLLLSAGLGLLLLLGAVAVAAGRSRTR
jgi:peptide/nickel transport system substrate-binding protein